MSGLFKTLETEFEFTCPHCGKKHRVTFAAPTADPPDELIEDLQMAKQVAERYREIADKIMEKIKKKYG